MANDTTSFAYFLIFISAQLILFPNCKINIGLNITRKRTDGYHDLETIFYPIYKLHDAVEILPADLSQETESLDRQVNFLASGLTIEGSAENNLSLKAYHLLKKDFPDLPPIHICLHKAIPMGGGLGGGSADGAFTLLLLNKKFHLNLLESQLLDYALQLGSDCPFFILNKPAFASGRGELLEPISLNLNGYSIVLVHPGIHILTAQAFAGIKPKFPINSLRNIINEPIGNWKNLIVNDFEETVFSYYSLLRDLKEKLYTNGAIYASMSGSGSTVYGIFKKENLPAQKLFPSFFEFHTDL